jgi:hypothetical protein
MKSFVQVVALLIVGCIIGFAIYAQWGMPVSKQSQKIDSILVTEAYADENNFGAFKHGDRAALVRDYEELDRLRTTPLSFE